MKKIYFFFLLVWMTISAFGQTQAYLDAQKQAGTDALRLGLKFLTHRNIWVGPKDNVIHMFVFEDGNLLLRGYPTTATEKNLYQLHLYVTNKTDKYLLQYTGVYQPALNIQSSASNTITPSKANGLTTAITSIDFAVIGPFTDNLVLTLKKADASNNYNTLTTNTIQISKTIYASIGSAIIYTTLRNPKNVKSVPKSGGDSTLLADDPKGRALLTVMATFYPWGRNSLMMPEWNFKDRFGIVVGTTLGSSSSSFGDILFGGQYDFSAGGSFVAGLHYGRRQKITGVDYNHYSFGEDKFTGDLTNKTYMAWNCGFFVGVQIDSRIFGQLFAK